MLWPRHPITVLCNYRRWWSFWFRWWTYFKSWFWSYWLHTTHLLEAKISIRGWRMHTGLWRLQWKNTKCGKNECEEYTSISLINNIYRPNKSDSLLAVLAHQQWDVWRQRKVADFMTINSKHHIKVMVQDIE